MLQLLADRLPNLLTVFFGIFLEASPFLLFGVLVSSVLDVAISADRVSRFFPRNGVLGLFSGVALGAAAPLCECGTVPIARGSISKGVPLPAAVGFLLAAPVINPITVAATYTAFQNNIDVLVLRIVLGVLIALLIGGLFLFWPAGTSPLRSQAGAAEHGEHEHEHGHGPMAVLEHAHHELSALMVYLIGAATVAAVLQVFLPRNDLLSL